MVILASLGISYIILGVIIALVLHVFQIYNFIASEIGIVGDDPVPLLVTFLWPVIIVLLIMALLTLVIGVSGKWCHEKLLDLANNLQERWILFKRK